MADPRIRKLLIESGLFRAQDEALLDHLVPKFELVSVSDGETFIREGDEGDALYLVVSGRFRVTVPSQGDILVDEGGPAQIVGDVALLTREPRSASVHAVGDVELARLPRSVFDELDTGFPDAFVHTQLGIIERQRHNRIEHVVRASGIFGPVDEGTLADLESRMEWVTLTSGEQLIAQGDPGDSMYILIHGRLAVSIQQEDGTRVRLAEIKRGQSVGETALVTGRPRSTDVHAIRDSGLVRLSQEGFDELVRLRPEFVVRNLAGGIIGRLTAQANRVETHARGMSTLAVLPLHPDVDLERFGRRLEEAFGTVGRSLRLTRRIVDDVFGPPSHIEAEPGSPGREILAGWLSGREDAYDHLLLQGEYGLTEWTRICLRQADEVLWVADSDASPTHTAFHEAAEGLNELVRELPESLALLHSGSTPSGTAAWLEVHEYQRHHHVRHGNQGDVERIARFLTDRAVGLVFSGGAARGFAHAGVVRALREAGVPIDCVGGVSMGAIMGALCAQERDPADMIRTTLQLTDRVMDPTLPLVAVAKGKKFNERIDRLFGDARIEDLPLPSFYLSANLTLARVEMHDCGSIAIGVSASNAPPGLGPPVVQDGDLLVDGFVLNNLPVDLMRGFVHGGPIVAVDVMPATDLPDNVDYGRHGLSGWKVFWRKLNPFLEPVPMPSIAEIIMRSHELYSVMNQRALKDATPFYVQPPISGYDMFDYTQGQTIADSAYELASELIPGWADALMGRS